MGKKAFSSLKSAVEAESFADGKLQVISAAAKHHHFRVNQVIQLIDTISFSGKKMTAVRRLYPKVVDRKNSYKLLNAFTYESDKKELRDLGELATHAEELCSGH